MKVIRAEEMGMCFGVRDALQVIAMHVECAEELEPEWFDDVDAVGLTAGTSTLDETIDGVHQALERIALSRQKGKAEQHES